MLPWNTGCWGTGTPAASSLVWRCLPHGCGFVIRNELLQVPVPDEWRQDVALDHGASGRNADETVGARDAVPYVSSGLMVFTLAVDG